VAALLQLRLNNVFGTAAGNPCTLAAGSGSTTITWSSAPAFPTITLGVSSARLVIEAGTANEEIVLLTAYVSGGTTGTVVRAQEGSTAIAHTATAWLHGPSALDFPSAAVAGNVGGPITIPGLSGSPDIVPSSPGAANDEFDQNTAGVPSGWSSFGASGTWDTNTVPSHLHILSEPSVANVITAVFKSSPSAPFTMTAKIADCQMDNATANVFMATGLFVGIASPGTGSNAFTGMAMVAKQGGTGAMQTFAYTGPTTNPSGLNTALAGLVVPPLYVRVAVNGAGTTAVFSASLNGMVWFQVASIALGFTVASIGLYTDPASSSSTSTPAEAYFDYVRFT
jgi:hypothetical protein